MAGFRNVRPPTREMQANQQARDASMTAAQATAVGQPAVGEKGAGHFDEPVVNALADLPNLAQAQQYAGTQPSFYGVQRPEDYARVVQQQMAADALPGGQDELANRVRNRIAKATIGHVA